MNADMLNRETEDRPPPPLSLSLFFLGGGEGANVPSAHLWIRHRTGLGKLEAHIPVIGNVCNYRNIILHVSFYH